MTPVAKLRVLVVSPGFGGHNRGSFVQTLDGLVKGLEAHGVPVTCWEAESLGHEDGGLPSFVGVTHVLLLGPPTGQQWLRLILAFAAKKDVPVYWMLAANSLTLPRSVLGFLEAYPQIQLLTPSKWSARVISALLCQSSTTGFGAPDHQRNALVVPHGVEIDPARVPPVTEPGFAHAVAGTTGRKGTEELFEAMRLLPDRHLVAYADATAMAWVRGLAEDYPNVSVRRAYNGDDTPGFWRHETFVQPSRAEGFGLCAVEAWMLGARVVMRRATGEPRLDAVTLVAEDPKAETWEGGDGAVLHAIGGQTPLTIASPEAIAAAIRFAESLPHPEKPAPYLLEPFRFSVAITPLVTRMRESA